LILTIARPAEAAVATFKLINYQLTDKLLLGTNMKSTELLEMQNIEYNIGSIIKAFLQSHVSLIH